MVAAATGKDVHVGAARGIEHPARDVRRVIHGAGVRHGADGGKSAGGGGHGAAGNGLFVRLSGLTQVDVNINEAGRDDQSAGVEALVGLAAQLAGGSDFRDAAVLEQQIVLALKVLCGVDEETVADCRDCSYCSSQNLFSREFTRMNTNSFIAIFEDEPLELGLWSEVKQKSYFNVCRAQIIQNLGFVRRVENPGGFQLQHDCIVHH